MTMRHHFIAFVFYALVIVAASASNEAQDEPLEKVTEAVLCKNMPSAKPTRSTRKPSKKPRRPTKKPLALPTRAPTTQPTQSSSESQAPWPIRIRYPVSVYTPTSPPSTYAEAPYADWIDPVKYPLTNYTHPPTSTPSGRVAILTQHPTPGIDGNIDIYTFRPFTFSAPSIAPTYVEFLEPQGP